MDCLNNRIGILGCGAPESTAELNINQLPGVSLHNIDALADGDEQQTFLEVWSDVTLRAKKKFEILAKGALNKCYRITDRTIVECLICEKVNEGIFDVALWYFHGVELMIERTSTDSLSRYTTIDLDKAEQLKTDFFQEFIAALDEAMRAINPEDSDCVESGCVECNDVVKFVEQLP